jgi:drug/metabolite transporter (DMT)-like permease
VSGVQDTRGTSDPVTVTVFCAVIVLASGNAVAVRVSNAELDWLWGAALRFLLAAGLMVALMTLLRVRWPHGAQLRGAFAFGALSLAGTFSLTYWALQTIQAGLSQTLLALVPLATLLLAAAIGQERLTIRAITGATLAVAGVAVVAWQPAAGPVPVSAVLAMLGAVVCMATGTIAVRRSPAIEPVAMNAAGILVAAAMLGTAALATGRVPTLPTQPDTRIAVLYLAAVGSVVVFSLQLFVLRRWSASRANYGFVLIPPFTIALSAWIDDEPVGPGLLVGGTLIAAGVYLGALRRTWHHRARHNPSSQAAHG